MASPYGPVRRAGRGQEVLEGVPADEGLALLAERVEDVVWLDRSAFLSASFGHRVPWLRHEAPPPLLRTVPAPRSVAAPRQPAPRAFAVALAPEYGGPATRWARAHGHRLLAADAAIAARAADSIDCLELFRIAGVPVADHVVVPAHRRRSASAYWDGQWEQAVLERRESGPPERSPVPVSGPEALEEAMAAWPGRALKLSRVLPGRPLAVNACAAADRTVVSAVSQRLAGPAGPAADRGAPEGDQLLGPDELAAGVYERVRGAALRVGDVLRERGYRGVFGVDLLADGTDVVGVGISPRFRAVAALSQAAEHAAGLLPALGLHILACLLPALPGGSVSVAPVPRLSQFAVRARRRAHLPRLPAPGRYRLDPDGSVHGPLPGPLPSLPELGADEALWWPQTASGPVEPGDALLLMQFGRPVLSTASHLALGPRAETWRDAAVRAFGGNV
ncbi:hypothetical protein AB0J21_22415 [Streptomyces sp. NPDC049954]|uniref:hypothetical protein n=1 Tax=Streptomyces sp. NPDC049954 TaxID=3155779 RepID=UPI0034361B43